uniref:Uncharacterized protein n=1 Tax=Romanomermis culicivorax TaxID=13658 RepID=A0A915JNB0_ROMCU
MTPNMRIKIEPRISMTNTHGFWRPIYIRLGGRQNSKNKPSANFLEKIKNIFATYLSDDLRLMELSKLILDEIDALNTFDTTPKSPSYMRFYFLGMFSFAGSLPDSIYSNLANPDSPLVIKFADPTFPLVVFNFYKNKMVNVRDLLLGQFEHKAKTALIISIREYATVCSEELFRNYITYKTRVNLAKNFSSPYKIDYYQRINEYILVEYARDIHLRSNIHKNLQGMTNELHKILLDSFDPNAMYKGTFEFYVQGLFSHMSYLDDTQIQIDHFHSHIGYSIRLQNQKNVTQINFVKLRFSKEYFNHLPASNINGYQVLSILYEYNPRESYIRLILHFLNEQINNTLLDVCYGAEKELKKCSTDDEGEDGQDFYQSIAYNSFLGTELVPVYDKDSEIFSGTKPKNMEFRRIVQVKSSGQQGKSVLKLDCQSPYVVHVLFDKNQECSGNFLNFVDVNDRGPLCQYDALIESEGCLRINNNAQYGKFVYKLTAALRGPVNINLRNKANIEHTIYMKYIEIFHIMTGLNMRKENSNFSIEFTYNGDKVSINMHDEPILFDLTLAHGVHIRYEAGFFIYIDTANLTVAQFSTSYDRLLAMASQQNIILKAYPFYGLENIHFENYNLFMNSRVNSLIVTEPDYSDVWFCNDPDTFIAIDCSCQMGHDINEMLFQNVTISIAKRINQVTIDLNKLSRYAAKGQGFLSLTPKVEKNDFVITVYFDPETEIGAHVIGNIILSNFTINYQYATVQILSESDSILEKIDKNNFQIVPVTKTLRSLNPLIQIDDRMIGQENQTIILPDRALTNFDYIIADFFTIYITNAVSDIMKSFMVTDETLLTTVVIHDQHLRKMRTLKLQFKDGVKLDLEKLSGNNESTTLDSLNKKLSARISYIQEKMILLQQDSRFDTQDKTINI